MMMSMVFSVGSIILGLIAIAIPFFAIRGVKFPLHSSLYSFTACTLSLLLQFYEIKNRVELNDFSAIMDTINTLCMVATVFIIVVIIINAVAMILHNRRIKKEF